MYIKKLISVVLMWSLVISFFAYLKPLPVCADVLWGTKIVPFVDGKGFWDVDYQGIRVYIGKDNNNEIERQNYGCIDIVKNTPKINNIKIIPIAESPIDDKEIKPIWNDNDKPTTIYVDKNFELSFTNINRTADDDGSAGHTEKENGKMYETFTIIDDVCDTILRKYSNGINPSTNGHITEIKNIWWLLLDDYNSKNNNDQKSPEDLIKQGYYLVVEPLAWTMYPENSTNPDRGVYIYGTLQELISYDMNSCQLFSGILNFEKNYDIYNVYRNFEDNFNGVFDSIPPSNVSRKEQWNLLYIMALSTSREKGDNFGKDVAEIFAKHIRWYGNNLYFENDENKQIWYYMQYATDVNKPPDYNDFTEDWHLERETIRDLYNDILNQGYYRIKCKTDILVSTVDGPYTTDSDVYTTVNIKNISGNDINIGNITSQFSASYPVEIIDSSGTNAFNTTHLADKETACVSIKWHTPASPANIHFTADIYQENNDPTAVIVSPVEFDVLVENQKSEEDYSNIGADISDVFAVNKKIKETYDSIYSLPYYDTTIKENIGRWQKEYGLDENNKYHSGAVYAQEFVKDNQLFQNSLNFNGYPLDIRSYISGNQKISDRDTVKSGYGIGLSLDYNGNDMMTYKSAKLIILYPEYGYDMKYASVADYSEIYNRYILKSSPVSSYGSDNEKSRVHFIPEWWQNNTEYKIYWVLTDMWTPSGEVCTWGEISLNIDGSFYDDWYITRNIGDD